MADQFRHDFVGFAGADWLRTPNLDALAGRSAVFTRCCTNSPVCAPARIALATGIQPWKLGALDNHAYLPLSRPTVYSRFRDSGYRVACVGKLDLAKPDPYNGRHGDRPVCYSWGFTHPEECEGKMHAGRVAGPQGPYTFWLEQRGLLKAFTDDYAKRAEVGWSPRGSWDSVLPADSFEDAYIGRRSADWTRNVPTDFPWFMQVSFVGPHDPFDPPTQYASRYRDAQLPPPIPHSPAGKPAWSSAQRKATAEEIDVARRQYCAAIELIDDQVGHIMHALEESGQAAETIIVFVSDHGEMLGDHGRWRKAVFYESALRVPLTISLPGERTHRRVEALAELIDLTPTLLDAAGIAPLPGADAHSLLPLLRGQTSEHRQDCASALRTGRCLRTDRWKLIESADGVVELYDLQIDPEEQSNVAAEQPKVARELKARLVDRWMDGRQAW